MLSMKENLTLSVSPTGSLLLSVQYVRVYLSSDVKDKLDELSLSQCGAGD